jgi:UDPglucose--hexose-1-phosphate uridylyltransferase
VNLEAHSHRRRNLLTGDWVLVSPQRSGRPWQGQVDIPEAGGEPAYDPDCHLCPGNARAVGVRNPAYTGGFAFDNDFPALSGEAGAPESAPPLFVAEPVTGNCRVACYSARHDLRLATMDDQGVAGALEFLFGEFTALDRRADIAYVQLFENRGRMMGCSNPHPHAQLWATSSLPNEVDKERVQQAAYFRQHGRPLLLDYLEAERADGTRLVCDSGRAVSLVPFWAVWPFETLLLPTRPVDGPGAMDAEDLTGLARVLRLTLAACERLFATPVPYSMGFHPRPSDGAGHPEWQFHVHIHPPLLRSATVRKHMVGFEMFAMPQRDLTPEAAAEQLREAAATSGQA